MKRWLAVLGVLLAGALLLPQHAWSQGAIVNNGLQLQGTPLSITFFNGTNTGTLLPASLSGDPTWTLPAGGGIILVQGSAAGGDLTGTYPNPTIANDAVTSAKIADGAVTNAKLAGGIAVSKLAVTQNYLIVGDASGQGSLLAPGSPGQVLTIVGGAPQWADLPSIAETDPVWTLAEPNYGNLTQNETVTGTWTFSNTINGSISGNAGTATALQTARNFALSGDVTAPAVSFDGTGNVTLSTTIANDAVTSAKIADGAVTNAKLAGGIAVSKLAVTQNYLIVGDASGQGSLLAPGSPGQVLTIVGGAPQWADLPSIAETDPVWTLAEPNYGNLTQNETVTGTWTFSNTINGSISGNAGTATALQTARNFALSGDVTAPAVSFDGTGNVTLSTTIANDAVTSAKIADGAVTNAKLAGGIAVSKLAVTQNYLIVGDASGQGSLLAPGSPGQVLTIVGGAPQWADLPSIAETDPVWTLAEPNYGNLTQNETVTGTWTFSNTINGSISGNAGTATALQTARNFALSGDVTAPAVSFDGTGNVTLSTTIANDAVTSAKIADGAVTNAKLAGGIAVSKLAVTQNYLIVGDASGQGSLLAPGSPGQVLTIVGGAPQWADLPSIAETDPVWTLAEPNYGNLTQNETVTGTWTFSNTINGSISGNAGTATALQTARNFALSGDVTAPAVSFDGTGNVTLSTTIANDAVTSAKIADGTIVDADIASNAGIAVSKLAVAANNLIVGDGSGQGSLLAPGSNGQVLTIVSGTPTWASLSAAGGWAVGGNNLGGGGTGILGTTSNDNLEVRTNNTLAMYIRASDQYVGIGTNDPQSRLHVHGSAVRVTNSSTGSDCNRRLRRWAQQQRRGVEAVRECPHPLQHQRCCQPGYRRGAVDLYGAVGVLHHGYSGIPR
jgi:DNA-directed RNA polymerase subunit H (RpoH/RPB5)